LTNGEEAEFTALVQRQSRFVFRVAYAVLLNSYDAEDAAQEVFLKLYRNRGWRNLANERAFLARVAWRVAVDRRRPAQHAAFASLESGLTANPVEDSPTPGPGPEQTLLAADQHAIVHGLIDALPEELRLPLVLSSFDELSSREIGGILRIPEGTVRSRLVRARQLLREKLASLQGSYFVETRHA
jgi:RNA polymerase sigma-70 factor (ECF subfamily)